MGLSVMLHLLRYRELAVVHYSGVPCALHLQHALAIAQLRFIIPEVVYICGLYLFLYLKWYTFIIKGDFYTR